MTTRVVHCKKEKFDVYIGRPGKWGNPFVIRAKGDETVTMLDDGRGNVIIVDSREDAIRGYEVYLSEHPELVRAAKKELKGKVLGCWCKPKACHGDVLARIADED